MASGEGFLTDEQRKMMKVASMNSENTSLSSSPRQTSKFIAEHPVKVPSQGKTSTAPTTVRHVRRTHSGKHIRVKKDGAGGKGTWGKLIDTEDDYIDRNDPNYDSGEEPYKLIGTTIEDPLEEYKKKVASIIEEYFSNGEVETAASDLRDLGSNEYHSYFIKRLVSKAMDRHDKEKEMASVLLSALYADVISPMQILEGFAMLVESADDLEVDILDAGDVLALFVARAIVDEILPPAFIHRKKKSLAESSKGFMVLHKAEKTYLSAPHHAELVLNKWGGKTITTVDKVKEDFAYLLREYVENGDVFDTCQSIRELGVPFFHHEAVKRALTLAMETGSAEASIMKLLKEAYEEGVISSSQMIKGFARFADNIDDLVLDIPCVISSFERVIPKAISEGWLDSSFTWPEPPENGKPDDEEEIEKLSWYKKKVLAIIEEYFLSDDVAELIQSLGDLQMPQCNPIFLKKLITLAMDRKQREKEMASVLVSSLHVDMFSTDDIVEGFILLLECADDTLLDVRDVSNELALFLARAVMDDVLAPLNLEEMSEVLGERGSGLKTIRAARAMIAARHAGERILRCWGGGTGWAVEDAKDKIAKLLEEFESGGDVSEACRCIRELDMPFFNHEVVKKALIMAMEKNKDEGILKLLGECFIEGLITTNQMSQGFGRLEEVLGDLSLDIPCAHTKFELYSAHALQNGWLSSL